MNMLFRNLTFFRFAPSVATGLANLTTAEGEGNLQHWLAQHPLKPAGPLELGTRGFVPPHGAGSEALFHSVNRTLWLTLGGEDKIFPAAVINDELAKRLAKIEEAEGRKLGGRARKQLKDDIAHEFLPRAFVKRRRLSALIDLDECFVAVDTSSRKQAEGFVSELRHALGSFPAVPLQAGVSVRAVLTRWLHECTLFLPVGVGSDRLSIGDACVMEDPVENGERVAYSRSTLESRTIGNHLESGKRCTRLELCLNDRVQFALDEDLCFRKFKLLDVAIDSLENTEKDSVAAELDARHALLALEVRALFRCLAPELRLLACEDGPSAATRVPGGEA
jgi:recombination associated protein RdgC